MNSREAIYQQIFMRQRNRYIIESGGEWPGKPGTEKAMTFYPNILAELDASKKTLDELAEIARVSPEIMAAVLEDLEDLREKEFRRLSFRLGADQEYLSDTILRMVKTGNEEGDRLFIRLENMVAHAAHLEVAQLREAERIKTDLKEGKAVTYAEYRWGCQRLKAAIECYQKRGGKYYGVRTKRITKSGR